MSDAGKKTVLAFDVETRLLASEVEAEFREKLRGESPWTHPELFGFGVGVAVDVETGMALRFGPEEPAIATQEMAATLALADTVVSYNGEAFDFEVLLKSADDWPVVTGYVEAARAKHLDLNAVVMKALDEVPVERHGMGRLRQGGLDGLAKANGVAGKIGEGASAPELLRAGKVEELFSYCEQDARIVAALYEIARERGVLRVEPYVRGANRERVYLAAVEVAVPVEVGGER